MFGTPALRCSPNRWQSQIQATDESVPLGFRCSSCEGLCAIGRSSCAASPRSHPHNRPMAQENASRTTRHKDEERKRMGGWKGRIEEKPVLTIVKKVGGIIATPHLPSFKIIPFAIHYLIRKQPQTSAAALGWLATSISSTTTTTTTTTTTSTSCMLQLLPYTPVIASLANSNYSKLVIQKCGYQGTSSLLPSSKTVDQYHSQDSRHCYNR